MHWVVYLVLSLLGAASFGVLATTSHAPLVLAATAAAGLILILIERFGSGCAAGLLILAGLDALPGPNLETTRVANSITAQDVAVAALIILLIYRNRQGDYRLLTVSTKGRQLRTWAVVFLAWYVLVILRTWASTPVPLVHAVTFTRDFLYFAVLLPLMVGPFRQREFRRVALITLGSGALVAAIAETVAVAGHTPLSVLVHTYQQGQQLGLTRLYTSASDIPFAGLPLGFGLFLFGQARFARIFGAVLALVSLTAVLVGLTRAMYLGETVGLTFAVLVTLLRGDSVARVGRRQFSKALCVIVLAVGAVSLYSPPSSSTLTGASQRASSLLADLTGSQAGGVDFSLQTREVETQSIEKALGAEWPIGLGALDPSYDYVSNVPDGNIRNPDVSLLGAVAAIGAIGVAIYAFPLFSLLFALLADRWRVQDHRDGDWLAFGGLAWCVAALVASPTLGFFFVPAQVVGSATVLALIAGLLAERASSSTRGTRVGAGAAGLPGSPEMDASSTVLGGHRILG